LINKASARVTRVVGLCSKGSKKKAHKVHIQTIDPRFLNAWGKARRAGICKRSNGWTKRELRLEGSEVAALGMIRFDGLRANYQGVLVPSKGTKYLDMWTGLKSFLVKRILETELSRGKKITLRPRACPECFEKFMKENHIRERRI